MSAVKLASRQDNEREEYYEPSDIMVVQGGTVTTFEVGAIERTHQIFAVAEEKGGRNHGYATTVCLPNGGKGRPFKILEQSEGWICKHRFDLKKDFVTIRIENGRFTIERHVLRRYKPGVYRILSTSIAEKSPYQAITGGLVGEACSEYAEAIAACVKRMSCECCQQICYGNVPGTSPRRRKP